MLNSKKAQLGKTFAMIIAVIIIFLFFFVYMWAINNIILFKDFFQTRTVDVRMLDKSNSVYSLNSYLSAILEVQIDNAKKNVTVNDMIKLWNIENNNEYRKILQAESEKIFEPFTLKEKNIQCYYLEIKNYLTKSTDFQFSKGTSESLMPIQIGDKNLAIFEEKTIVEIPLADKKKTTASLIINNMCLKEKNGK